MKHKIVASFYVNKSKETIPKQRKNIFTQVEFRNQEKRRNKETLRRNRSNREKYIHFPSRRKYVFRRIGHIPAMDHSYSTRYVCVPTYVVCKYYVGGWGGWLHCSLTCFCSFLISASKFTRPRNCRNTYKKHKNWTTSYTRGVSYMDKAFFLLVLFLTRFLGTSNHVGEYSQYWTTFSKLS